MPLGGRESQAVRWIRLRLTIFAEYKAVAARASTSVVVSPTWAVAMPAEKVYPSSALSHSSLELRMAMQSWGGAEPSAFHECGCSRCLSRFDRRPPDIVEAEPHLAREDIGAHDFDDAANRFIRIGKTLQSTDAVMIPLADAIVRVSKTGWLYRLRQHGEAF